MSVRNTYRRVQRKAVKYHSSRGLILADTERTGPLSQPTHQHAGRDAAQHAHVAIPQPARQQDRGHRRVASEVIQ